MKKPIGSVCPSCGKPCRCRNGCMKCLYCGATGMVRLSFLVGDQEVSYGQFVQAVGRLLGIGHRAQNP
jgi:hypothetical protein